MSAGYRSLLAFWLGGAAKPTGITPPTPTVRTTFILRHRRVGDVALPTPPTGSLYRLRRAKDAAS